MNASKESCEKAKEALSRLANKHRDLKVEGPAVDEDMTFIDQFLMAAYKRLPTDASLQKDKERRGKKTTK